MKRAILSYAIACCLPCSAPRAQVSSDTPGWFPFASSPVASLADTPVDVSFLNGGPADSRISVRGPHFVDARGDRVRFLGTNVTFAVAFPDKAHTPALAARMAQLGMNVMRFHHMDARDIWLPEQKGLDPEKLDRLDWFIYQLKQHGIYTNINLHVSRTYPGLKELDAPRTFRYGKTLDNFYEPYIRLQEQYARALLDRVNPYTKLKLSEDPAVAFVEINNENTLLNLHPGALGGLPEPHRDALRQLWSTWLAERHGSLSELLDKWNTEVIPLGPEMVRDQVFVKGLEEWHVEGLNPGICDATVVDTEDGGKAMKMDMREQGKVAWAYQFHQLGVELEEGQVYTLRFRARSDKPRTVSTALRFAEPPWTILGVQGYCALTPEWKDFTVVGRVAGIQEGVSLRLSINMGDAAGTVWVRNVSLRTGKERFEPKDVATLADLPLPDSFWPDNAQGELRRFLIDTEQQYVRRMKTFLQRDLGVKSLIVDTQASYGGYWGLYREASLCDYIDMHSYWQHPRFPGKPWDGSNWNIPNTSMVAATRGSTFERLTEYRLANRPFSVSEYDHPAPNDHAAELFPMISAYAGHQDWDALYQFCYGSSENAIKDPRLSGYFTLATHSGKVVFAPIAALAFRNGLVPPATSETVLTVPLPALDEKLAAGFASLRALGRDATVPPRQFYGTRFAVTFAEKGVDPQAASAGDVPSGDGPYIDNGAITWDPAREKPVFLVRAPAVRMAVGEIAGQDVALGDVTVSVRPFGSPWACVAMAAKDSKPIAKSAAVLLAAASRVENTNMAWNDDRTSVSWKWGSSPTLAQAVPLRLVLPGQAKPNVVPLGPAGQRRTPITVGGTPGNWTVDITQKEASLWYIIER